MSRPVSITIAVIVQWAGAVVALIGGLDLIGAAVEMSRGGVSEQLEATLAAQGLEEISGSLLVVGVGLAGVLVCALALARVLVAGYLWQGRNWARLVIAVLVAINMVGAFAYLIEGYWLRFAAAAVIDVLMLWLMFNAQSSEFVAARRAARREAVAA